MARPITLFTSQWADLPLDKICSLAAQMGYDGLELTKNAHLDAEKMIRDPSYAEEIKHLLTTHGLDSWAISAHLDGQCVGDAQRWAYDPRLDNFAPKKFAGKPQEIQKWAVEQMMITAHAAQMMDIHIVTFFMGSPIWKFWYSFPQTQEEVIQEGYEREKELWTPIFDEFDRCNVRLALEIHPSEIAFDYWSTQRLLETFDFRPTLGINFDPSHLYWQGVDPGIFLYDFRDRIYHVHIKDVKKNLNGRNGILGSHITFGDQRRGWNFVSPGHGDVDFDNIIRMLNQIRYTGPLSVEWEDSGMDRMTGAAEALNFTRKVNFSASEFAFDSAIKNF